MCLNDQEIIELYESRSEQAIAATDQKYGAYLHSIARGITGSEQDAQECVNDTYLRAWNSIPPAPARLGAYLARIARNIALDAVSRKSAQRRGGGELTLMLSELEDSLPDTAGQPSDQGEISAVMDSFLRELEPRERAVFIRRYFYADSVADIAKAAGLSYRAVTSMLHRTRKKLRARLQKEGIIV